MFGSPDTFHREDHKLPSETRKPSMPPRLMTQQDSYLLNKYHLNGCGAVYGAELKTDKQVNVEIKKKYVKINKWVNTNVEIS